MAIVGSHLLSNGDASDLTSYTTGTVTPTANRLVFFLVTNGCASAPNVPTVTGASMTWTQVATGANASHDGLTLFRALSSSPGSGACTIDFGGQTQTSCDWSVVEFTGMVTSGTNGADAVVQGVANNGGTATSGTVTLSAFSSIQNATFGGFRCGASPSVGAGFTLLGTANSVFTEWKNTNDTSVDASWTNAGWVGIAAEIKAQTGTGFIALL